MKLTSAWIRYPTEAGFHRAAGRAGLGSGFLGPAPAGTRDRGVLCLGQWSGASLVVCVPLFRASREIGLWVAPDWRGGGLGSAGFAQALRRVSEAGNPLYASVQRQGRHCAEMEHILHRAGFAKWARNAERALWARPG